MISLSDSNGPTSSPYQSLSLFFLCPKLTTTNYSMTNQIYFGNKTKSPLARAAKGIVTRALCLPIERVAQRRENKGQE